MSALGKYVSNSDPNYSESVRNGAELVDECVRAFEASRVGKKKIYSDHNSFFSTFGTEQLSLKVSIPNVLRVVQIQRRELPFTPFYPRIKYKWSVVCEVQEPAGCIMLKSIPLGVLYYPENRHELTSKEQAKQPSLPKITVAVFANPPKPLVGELLDARRPSERLFEKVIDAFEHSRKHKKSEVNYGHEGYGVASDLILIHGKATLVKIIKEEFAYRASAGWWDLVVRKKWSMVYITQYSSYFGKTKEEHVHTFARIHYFDQYSPTGRERDRKTTVLTFPNTPEYTIDSQDIATGKLVDIPKEFVPDPVFKQALKEPTPVSLAPKSPRSERKAVSLIDPAPSIVTHKSPSSEPKAINIIEPAPSVLALKSPPSERKTVKLIDPVVLKPTPRLQPILKKRSDPVKAPVKRDDVKKPKATGARSRESRERRMKEIQRAQRAMAPKNRYTLEPIEARVVNYEAPGAFKYRPLEFPPLDQ